MGVTDNSKAFIESVVNLIQRKRPNWFGLGETVRSLAPLGLTSTAELVRTFPTLSGEQLIAAIEVAGVLKLRRLGPRLVPLMESPDPGLRWYAQIALSDMASRRTY